MTEIRSNLERVRPLIARDALLTGEEPFPRREN